MFTANIISLAHGCVLSWTSPVIPFLRSEASPLDSGPITIEEASWIGSLNCAGGLIGNFVYAYLADKFGRKKAILCLALPQIMFWLCVIYAKNVFHLYVGRSLAGLCGGGMYVIITIFTTEIAQDKYVNISNLQFLFIVFYILEFVELFALCSF